MEIESQTLWFITLANYGGRLSNTFIYHHLIQLLTSSFTHSFELNRALHPPWQRPQAAHINVFVAWDEESHEMKSQEFFFVKH